MKHSQGISMVCGGNKGQGKCGAIHYVNPFNHQNGKRSCNRCGQLLPSLIIDGNDGNIVKLILRSGDLDLMIFSGRVADMPQSVDLRVLRFG